MRSSVMTGSAVALIAGALLVRTEPGMRAFQIIDPVLQMPAWTLQVPEKWSAEGTMLPGSTCSSATTPVFRAASPDGKTGAYFLPRSDWAWGTGIRSGSDCLQFHEVVTAKDYLTYLIRIRQVGFVREEPVPELADLKAKTETMNQQMGGMRHITNDMARYEVRYSVNGQPVDEWITATVQCSDAAMMGNGHQYGCSAYVSRWFAPLGKLDAAIPSFKAMKLSLNQPWMDKWTAVMVQRVQAQSKQQTDAMLEQGRLAQSQRMQEHQDFMGSMQRGRDLRNEQFKEGQYQKTRNKEDYVDYILDCQRASNDKIRISVGNCPVRETR
ncbi:MAG: hypothetical protein ABJD11_16910 [Gemmatimonadota bacterium]